MNMKFIEQDVLDKAVLFKAFLIAQSTDGSVSAEELASQFGINIGVKRVKLACEALSEQNRMRYFAQTGRGSISAVGYKYVEDALRNETSIISQYAVNGDDWLAEQTVGQSPAAVAVVAVACHQSVAVAGSVGSRLVRYCQSLAWEAWCCSSYPDLTLGMGAARGHRPFRMAWGRQCGCPHPAS